MTLQNALTEAHFTSTSVGNVRRGEGNKSKPAAENWQIKSRSGSQQLWKEASHDLLQKDEPGG